MRFVHGDRIYVADLCHRDISSWCNISSTSAHGLSPLIAFFFKLAMPYAKIYKLFPSLRETIMCAIQDITTRLLERVGNEEVWTKFISLF